MAEAEEKPAAQGEEDPDPGRDALMNAEGENAAGETGSGGTRAEAKPSAPAGPGIVRRALGWAIKWHPVVFLGAALALAAYAWVVYPKPQEREIPSARLLYNDGLDRLYRVINPDLPLLAATPSDEALAARNAFLNLFVFHRPNLKNYPEFINPHLLLGEANRLLAEFNPAMASKYYADAQAAYADAEVWETREDDARNLAVYVNANFLEGRAPPPDSPNGFGGGAVEFFEEHDEEITLRRNRRLEYIRYRLAEADVNLGRPETARQALEAIRQEVDGRRREEIRRMALDEAGGDTMPRRAFELGADEFLLLDFLLAKAYDGLNMQDRAKAWYLRYLASVPSGRNHAFVVDRLAAINMAEGELYHRVNPALAEQAYTAAIGYYQEMAASPSASRAQRDVASMGLANANARLADLSAGGEPTGIDDLNRAGRTIRGWLEEFSGQMLPRRTLALPKAVGDALAKPELLAPASRSVLDAAGGTLLSMAGGGLITPREKSRVYHTRALENFDRVAAANPGTEEGDRATVMAAREAWHLGRKEDTEARFARMIDPLSRPDLILAGRLGLATIALDRGDLDKAQMLMLGGYAHSLPLWFTLADADWRRIATRLGNPASRSEANPWLRVWETLPEEGTEIAAYAASGRRLDDEYVNRFLRAMNTLLRRADFYRPEYFVNPDRNFYLSSILSRDPELLTRHEIVWRNRMLLEESWPYDLSQRGVKNNIGFPPFPPGNELTPGGLVEESRVRELLSRLAVAWASGAAREPEREERLRRLMASNAAYLATLDKYHGDPGEILYAVAVNYESLAEIREAQGNHVEALSLTAAAARSYLDVSMRGRGSPREMDALLAAGDAFFRAGLLERTVESQKRFLERFGYTALPGTDGAMAVVRSENLLGRAYWFLSDMPAALESFGRNIPRRTPDRYKSIYYIGRVMMEEGAAENNPALLGSQDNPLPQLDRNGDPIIESALQAFNWLRQSEGINPAARAWRWSTFDLAKLRYIFAERARREWLAKPPDPAAPAGAEQPKPWLALYEEARTNLTEALDRYPLRRNGGVGISIRVEPEDYADTMAFRFETEYMLANTLLILAGGRKDEALAALARTHLANLVDRSRYANALFDPALDRFQVNSAVIREEVDGGSWDRGAPLPRTRLGDDEGPTHSPWRLREMLRNSMQLLAGEYFRAGDLAATREDGAGEAAGYYRQAYEAYQTLYDRFGFAFGSLAMLGMGDSLARLGRTDDADNHYRMARNIAEMQPPDTRSDGLLNIGPDFWGKRAEDRLEDRRGGYATP